MRMMCSICFDGPKATCPLCGYCDACCICKLVAIRARHGMDDPIGIGPMRVSQPAYRGQYSYDSKTKKRLFWAVALMAGAAATFFALVLGGVIR